MIDEMDLLRNSQELQQLLTHYSESRDEDGKPHWQNRLMQIEGVDDDELVKLHGKLLAFSWINQDTGGLACTYRVTPSGLRAIKRIHNPQEHDIDDIELMESNDFDTDKLNGRKKRKLKTEGEQKVVEAPEILTECTEADSHPLQSVA